MEILRSIDIEDEIRIALEPYIKTYCRPLPATFPVPSLLVSRVGGSSENTIDTFDVDLDSRATDAATADEVLRTAIGILMRVADLQTCRIRNVTINTIGAWGEDPMRPDLSLCTARLIVVAHREKINITEASSS